MQVKVKQSFTEGLDRISHAQPETSAIQCRA